MNNPFKDIVDKQSSYKRYYKHDVSPPVGGITICIKDNKIIEIHDGSGWVHPSRKKQYIYMIENCLKNHNVRDGNVNINLSDHPRTGVFNFCRKKGNFTQFLLPTFRFNITDIKIKQDQPILNTIDDVKTYIRDLYTDYKINKIYMSCIPHPAKIPYFKHALCNPDTCHGYAYIGSCHGSVGIPNDMIPKLLERGMCGKELMDWAEHLKYKYILYTDGNTLSDRMNLLLCSDCIVVKFNSPYEEFFSELLENNVNYVEIGCYDELNTVINNSTYDIIPHNNKVFMDTVLTYDNVLKYVADILNELISK